GTREAFTVEVKRKPPAGPARLSVEDVLDLLRGEVAPARIAALVNDRGVDFVLTEAVEQQLRGAGADSDLLLAITKTKK
ncbi:MAG: hypothetical protein ACRD2Y_14235, partial [Terriglobales bacterium]